MADVMPHSTHSYRPLSCPVAPLRMGVSLPELRGAAAKQDSAAHTLAVMAEIQQLHGMPVSALKRKARKLGASEAALDAADDATNTKNALIQIIMGGTWKIDSAGTL